MALIKAPVYAVKPHVIRAEGPVPMLEPADCAALLVAARRGRFGEAPPEGSVWSVHASQNQQALAQAIAADDAGALGDVLSQLHLGQVVKGFDQAGPETATLDADPMQQNAQGRRIYHALMRLGTGLGVIRAWNPEQAENFPYLTEDTTAEAVAAIRGALRLTGDFPRTTQGAWGIGTEHGLLSYRQALTLGYLREVDAHLARTGRRYGHIVEIGGGLGRMAFNLARRAETPVTVVDLPLVGVMQSAFLTANGVPNTLWPERLETAPGHVNLVSAFDTRALGRLKAPLVLNFDGLVEMTRDTQDGYFDLIRRLGGDLLSINHEAARMTGQGIRQEWQLARITDWGLTAQPRAVFLEREGWIAQSFLSRRGLLRR